MSHADAADFRRITHHFARVPHPEGSTSLRVRILRLRVQIALIALFYCKKNSASSAKSA